MTSADGRETILRDTLRTMDAARYQVIREAYYKAIEGLRTLADALETADAAAPGPGSDAMIGEHLLACEAIDVMNRSLLGWIL